jgi:predicted permease
MGVEVALALAVLLAAALFWRSFAEGRDADPGFKRDGVLLANYDYSGRNIGAAAARDFAARLLERLRAVPGVDSAALATAVPLDIHGLPLRAFTIEGRPSTTRSPDQALSNTVTPGYLRTMGIPILLGDDFADLRDTSLPPQVIVNEEFVRRFIANGEPIGRRVENRGTSYFVAGVARNSTNESFGEAPSPVVYFSYRDRPSDRGEIHLRTRSGAESLLAPELERVVRDLDPSLPLYDVRTLNEHVEKNLFLRRIPARMFVVLGPLLLLLAAIGIYAVVAYAVSQRTTEIGVRMALGATSMRVVSQIVGESLRVVAAGAMVAWFIAVFIAMHLVRGPIDRVVFGGVPLALFLVAAFASWLPARRATSVDVMTALRTD